MPNNTQLSKSTTVDTYKDLEASEDRDAIAAFLKERFTERYITPILSAGEKQHGFCIMAVCCLMIEALESFYQGLPDTKGMREAPFIKFFERNSELFGFQDSKVNFYANIRCGILHQAETKGGWRIWNVGPLLDAKKKTINAKEFLRVVQLALTSYCDSLRTSDWDSKLWQDFKSKMAAVCANTL